MRRTAILGLVLLLAAAAHGADWPCFLGPAGNGTAPDTNLIHAFPPSGPNVLWTVPLGRGFGSPAIVDGQVFVLDRDWERIDVLRCLDLATGNELWDYAYPAPDKVDFDGSRTTPAVDAKSVFIIGPFGQVNCIDRTSHQPVWSLSLLKDFGAALPRWGVALSPVLYKDWVIVTPQSNTVGVAALDKATGKPVWKSAPLPSGKLQYVTPLVTTIDGVTQVVVQNDAGAFGLDIQNGALLWSCDFKCQIPIPEPTPIGDGRLFLTGGYDAGHPRRNGAQIHRPLLIDNYLYALCNTNSANEGLVCLDLDGQEKWHTGKAPFLDKGNLIYADGVLWSMDGATGELRIIQPDPAAYRELACAKLLGGDQVWGCMSLASGRLLARDQKQLKCIDLRATEK